MASMFDQYNKTLKREEINPNIVNNVHTSSGYVSVRMKEEAPIFSKQKMNLNLPFDITHIVISSNWLIMLMSNHMIFRINLQQPDRQDEVSIEKFMNGVKVSGIFLDPLGNHLLIALASKTAGYTSELLYLHRNNNKARKLDKYKDHEVTAVAFNYHNTLENTTSPILLGTSKGLIFETEFSLDGDKIFQNNWKQVFDIGRGDNCPITGIECHKIPNTLNYIILVTTINRLYKFHEILKNDDNNKQPLLQNIFNAYLNVPEDIKDYHEIQNKLKYSKLRVNYDSVKKFPNNFGWLTEPGIFYGEIDSNADTPVFIVSNEIIPFPQQIDQLSITNETNLSLSKKSYNLPINFILTDFHAILLYYDHVTSVSLLNYQVIYEEYFSEQYGKLLDIVKDIFTGAIYVYSSKFIFRYKVTNEQRNVWHMYVDKNDFELAKKYCHDNPAHMDIVLVKQAEMLFNQKEYIKSAEIYSNTQSSFETICLKFLNAKNNDALIIFLRNKLNKLNNNDKTQITMIVVWLVELYLIEMSHNQTNITKLKELQKEFDKFMNLQRIIDCMRNNRTVIYDLMASHGDNYNLRTLTTFNKDYESVINQLINLNQYTDALNVLRNQNKIDIYYKYCPILIEKIPKETINIIIEQKKRLNPIKLLPTIICLDTVDHINEIIRYLEFTIHSLNCNEQSIHNYLIDLYSKYHNNKLMLYLETQGKDIQMINYDVHYALRVCNDNQILEACVFLQCLLELWLPAVELALTFNTKLAQQTASQINDRDLKRKLWLKIAEHEIRDKDDVKQALQLLKECDLLRIEDLLPYFSDFQKIDHFKEAICDALKEYNIKIQEQRKDMEESAKSAERVRYELQQFRNRSIIINSNDKCSICLIHLLLKPFLIFPCGHKFHSDCLEKQLVNYLSVEENQRLTTLKHKLISMTIQQVDNLQDTNNVITRDEIKNEIENILANDCLYCGELMINNIDKPFIDDWNKVNDDWN